jgi:hypothetical protein
MVDVLLYSFLGFISIVGGIGLIASMIALAKSGYHH